MLENIKELCEKSEDIGYNLALTDLMRELRIRHEDGFVLSDNLLTEVLDMLCEKRDRKLKDDGSENYQLEQHKEND